MTDSRSCRSKQRQILGYPQALDHHLCSGMSGTALAQTVVRRIVHGARFESIQYHPGSS
jgi:hypothetical protein